MTFALYAVEMSDFKSYAGEHTFEFPSKPGLYYLTGKNQYNPRLGANGSGKSTLVDAINWCFYGKTHRGLKASDVISWGKKKCKVSVSCYIDTDEFEITRTQNPNKILINNAPATQDEVTKLLRLNQEAFNNSVILPQFGESFFDLTPSRKLEIFSQVMNLDYWLAKSKQAALKAENLAATAHRIETALAKAESRRDSLKDNLTEYKAKADRHDKRLAQDVANIRAEMVGVEKALKKARKTAAKERESLDDVEGAIKEVRDEILKVGADFEKANSERNDVAADVKAGDRHLWELDDQLQHITRLQGEVCPTCKQRVKGSHVEANQDTITGNMKKVGKKLKADQEKLKALDKRIHDYRSEVNSLRKLKDEVEREYHELKSDIRLADRAVVEAEETLKRYTADIKRAEKADNPFRSMIAEAKDQLKANKADIKKHKAALADVLADQSAYAYWAAGFKKVRLFVIEEALNSLEVEVNNLLITLGLVGWKATFDVERETSTGGVSKGFTVFIQSPKHDKPVRFEAWSGGEVQRLRLAGDLGLANLIMEQAGFVNSIEIIDEPSEHMSKEGIEDLLETIHQRAHSTEKTIWLVDHHTVEFSGFSGTLTAVMNNEGKSHLEYRGM